MVIGTSLVYDIIFGIIPNYVLIAGYVGIIPIMYEISGWNGIILLIAAAAVFLTGLIVVYVIGGIGAGDVKLLSLVCGALGFKNGLKFLVIVFVAGAVMGLVKIVGKIAEKIVSAGNKKWNRTGIRFSVPVFAGYLIMLISGGGIM